MQRTYQELYPEQSFDHLARTVEQYLSNETPIWWVESNPSDVPSTARNGGLQTRLQPLQPIACLWLGNAIEQIRGDRQAYILLLYVHPQHRRRGIASALMEQAETWARGRGDRQMGLQVFQQNQGAIELYERLGYSVQSLWMTKPLQQ
jgi:ribosomal protein S18 acetylase RimI-like enzyme